MSTAHKELDLSLSQIKILRMIKRKGKITKEEVIKYKNDKYKFLFYYSLLDNCSDDSASFCLSPKAEAYLRFRRKDKYRFYLPLIISIAALIISVIALIKQ